MSFTLVKRNVAYVTTKKIISKLNGISQTSARSRSKNIKWDHFQVLANGSPDLRCKIKKTFLIRDLRPALNENVSSEKLWLS